MSEVTKPLMTDETGEKIVTALREVAYKDASGMNVHKSPALTDYLFGIGSEANYKTFVSDVAKTIIEEYASSNLAGSNQSLKSALDALNSNLMSGTAGFSNSIFRGKNLGTSFTAAQSTAIKAGNFADIMVGDYWTLGGKVYRIAGVDLAYRCGDTSLDTHHVVVVPDANMYSAAMNDTNTTEGGYVGSAMRTTNLAEATNTFISAFGDTHVLTYRDFLTNATKDGKASGWAWTDCRVELMSEIMVYGCNIWSQSTAGYEGGIFHEQFPLFRLDATKANIRANWWLRGIYSATTFARASNAGYAANYGASNSFGVRPFALIA